MGFDLMNNFRNMVDKEKLGKENTITITYDTGVDVIDYRLAKVDGDNLLTGINDARILTVCAKPGIGKSTYLIQSAWNIVKDIPNAVIYIWDFERSNSKSRIQSLTGCTDEEFESKIMLLNSEISIEKLYKSIRGLAKIKVEHQKELEIDSGRVDKNGKPYKILPPSIFIIDSWSTMSSDKVIDVDNEEDQTSNMTGAMNANRNTKFLDNLISVLEQARISLFIAAHIKKKVDTGVIKTAADLNYLAQDETIPGGRSALYLADTLLKFTAGSKLDKEKDYGIHGFVVKAKICKSRSNESGTEVDMVFELKKGFNNILTNFHNAKAAKLLQGNGRAYYFDFMPDYKFTQKTFVEKYLANPEFAEGFDNMVHELYTGEFVYVPDALDSEKEEEIEDEE